MARLNKEQLQDKWLPFYMPQWYYGIAVGEGWVDLVDDALEKICGALELHGYSRNVLGIHQIKEKFGGLRIYWTPNLPADREENFSDKLAEKIEDIIIDAEKLSVKTCDQCSSINNVKVGSLEGGRGWIVTMCQECRKNKQRLVDDINSVRCSDCQDILMSEEDEPGPYCNDCKPDSL